MLLFWGPNFPRTIASEKPLPKTVCRNSPFLPAIASPQTSTLASPPQGKGAGPSLLCGRDTWLHFFSSWSERGRSFSGQASSHCSSWNQPLRHFPRTRLPPGYRYRQVVNSTPSKMKHTGKSLFFSHLSCLPSQPSGFKSFYLL